LRKKEKETSPVTLCCCPLLVFGLGGGFLFERNKMQIKNVIIDRAINHVLLESNVEVPLFTLVGSVLRDIETGFIYFVQKEEVENDCRHCSGYGECDITHVQCWGRMDRVGPQCPICGGVGAVASFVSRLVRTDEDYALAYLETKNCTEVVEF
jgi:hypothetical protein